MNIIKITFANILHLFKRSEEKVAHAVSAVLHRTAEIIEDALPVVEKVAEIALKVEGKIPNKITEEVLKYIPTVVDDAEAIESFSTEYENTPLNAFLHAAAVFLVQHTKGHLQTDIKDLDTAVQMAYSTSQELKSLVPAK